jgi:hypothetical protein
MKKLIFAVTFIIPLFFNFLNSQLISKGSSQVLIKGIVRDKFDNKPLGVEIRFEDENGKFFKINSNSLTGNYEQILEAGKKYKVRLNSKTIFPTEYSVITNKTDNYTEQEQNFNVSRLAEGRAVDCFDLFDKNSTSLRVNIKELFDELNIKMRFNRGVSLFLEVGGCESRSNFTEIKISGKGKKKRADTSFNENDYNSFVQKRLTTLQSEIKNLSTFPDRIEVRQSTIGNQGHKEMSGFESGCDVILRVKEYKEQMKEK